MGPFSGTQFTVQVSALNRSRPSLVTHFKVPFSNLSSGMRAMHRTGFCINSVSTASQLISPEVKETKNIQPASQKKEPTKKTGSRRRQRKNA
ncbi:hypothetical protein N8654_02335 [Synechococcus sp. AH-601-B19]|uniref:CpcD-like domain-containing protein n=1 Tax=uncultured Synechococcus sp. TaxID=154535 RepID=A0A024CH94_9SYNE|nr:conserved hypothetical protein [uncultured Synechococcus sp.]MDA7436503.1 hypothetical protein [Synechococcus sp. AH-601-B19]|tara:strand:- start:672 stop:947 length:276 start_codon:yes stop_codon:yes gene_type:complete